MMRSFTRISTSLLSLAIASTAVAQAQEQESGIADIVVTATRQATNLQDTPIAITAVTAEALEERGLQSVADLTSAVPNAQFRRTQGAFGPGVSAFIRGIGQGDTSLGSDPAVAYYIDDVYYPILLGSNFDLLDIDHVEVLRGPQGTLFGRNTLAGAVNIVAKQPRFDESSAYLEATVGSYDRIDIRAGFNVPLGDNLALMVSGASQKRTGYMRRLDFVCEMNRRGTPNLIGNVPTFDPLKLNTPNTTVSDCTIGHLGGQDVRAIRGSMAWEPASNVRLTLTADYTQDMSENPADHTLDIDPAQVSAQNRLTFQYYGVEYDRRFLTGDPFSTYETWSDPTKAGTVIPGSTYYNGRITRGGYRLNAHGDLVNWGVSGKMVVGLTSDIDLTAIVGYRVMDETHTYAQDGTPLITEHTLSHITEKYGTGEVRLSGKMDWIDWVVGAFYFEAKGRNHAVTISPRNSVQRTQNTTYDPVSKAIFANATVRPFGDRLSFVGGLRYSDEKKVVNFSNLVDITPNAADIVFSVTPRDSRVSWKAGVNYEVNNNMLFYASAATGYTLPGFNPRPLQPSQATQFAGNDDIAYELGGKIDLFDRRLRINTAVFYTDFKTRPVSITGGEILLAPGGGPTSGNQVVIQSPGAPDGVTSCRARTQAEIDAGVAGFTCVNRSFFVNTPAKVRGFEIEGTAEPIDGLLINGALGYNKFTSPDLVLPTRLVNRRQNTPRWQANGGIQYEIKGAPLGGTITPRLDWSYQSSSTTGSLRTTRWNQGPYSLFNGRVSYRLRDEGLMIAVGATNLFDKLYYHNFFVYQDNVGDAQVQGQPGAPRQWYLNVQKTF
jgi:iron complex outermembrane receptor protein